MAALLERARSRYGQDVVLELAIQCRGDPPQFAVHCSVCRPKRHELLEIASGSSWDDLL